MALIMDVLRIRASELATLVASDGLSPGAALHLERFREALHRHWQEAGSTVPVPDAGDPDRP